LPKNHVARAEPTPSSHIVPCKFVLVALHKRLHRQQRITIDLAVQILRSALDKTSEGPAGIVPVCFALRCLWSHCPERWPLVMFWEGAQQENEIGRRLKRNGFVQRDRAPAAAGGRLLDVSN
jgi:hypothetical protein